MSPSVLALIPARAGSKRLPMKNFKSFARGPSLVERAVSQALDAACAHLVVVSTDRADLAQPLFSPEVSIHQRSPHAASDVATAWDVIAEVLQSYPKTIQTLIYLQPTSPLRTAQNIRDAFDLFKSGQFTSVVSVSPCSPSALYATKVGADNSAQFLFPEMLNQRSQDLPTIYALNGAIYIASVEHLKQTHSFIKGHVGCYKMAASPDIDTAEDWQEAEKQVMS